MAHYGLWSKSFYPTAQSSWHQHFKGIFIGCTLSIILFLSGINIVIEYVCDGKQLISVILGLKRVKKFGFYIICLFFALDGLCWFTKCLFLQSENLNRKFLITSESGYDFIIPSQDWPFILPFLRVLFLWEAWLRWWKRQRLAATLFFKTLLTQLCQTTTQTWKLVNGQLRTRQGSRVRARFPRNYGLAPTKSFRIRPV